MFRILVTAAVLGIAAVGIAPAASATPYRNCKAAAADGKFNIQSGDPGYGSWLDRDGDGIACESK